MIGVACLDGGAIGHHNAGVVELVDARDSKSRSARSVGSIPTARTIYDSRLRSAHRMGQEPATADLRAPLSEMTIERHCHVGTVQPIRDAAIATNLPREATLCFW